MTFDIDDPGRAIGATLYGPDQEKIGKIGHLYLDDVTGRPEWVTVATGLFGRRESFVPVEDAREVEEGIAVPFDKDVVKDAPNVDPDDGHISPEEEGELFAYYARKRGQSSQGDGSNGEDHRHDEDRPDHGVGEVRRDDGVGEEQRSAAGESDMPAPGAASGQEAPTGQPGGTRLRRWTETTYETVQVPVQRERVAYEDETDGS